MYVYYILQRMPKITGVFKRFCEGNFYEYINAAFLIFINLKISQNMKQKKTNNTYLTTLSNAPYLAVFLIK